MTEVTITEYETAERTVNKIECDHCGVVVDEDEATTVWLQPSDKEKEAHDELRGSEITQTITDNADVLDHNHHGALRGNFVVDPNEIVSELRNTITTPPEKHLCEDCVGLREAIAVRETKDYYRAFWEGTKGKIGWILLLIPTFIFGVAQGILFANTEAGTLVERVGVSFTTFLLMLCLGLVIAAGLYAILTADSSG